MRSLSLKLTLAFLLVGLSGALLMSLLIRQRTQTEFDQFVLDNYQQTMLERVLMYYEANGSWEGLAYWFYRTMPNPRMMRPGERPLPFTVLDTAQIVVLAGPEYELGQRVAALNSSEWIPIEMNGQRIGFLRFSALVERLTARTMPEADFLARINTAVFLSALGATAVALLLGALLARTLTQPIRQLTAATQLIAQGQLGHQVPINTDDELGELAVSFNQMSADLARINQSRRQMTADIAHDLRTPLSVILGYTEALSDGKLPGSPEIYAVMHKEAQHLQRLVEDLRTLSLADAGELPLNRQPTDPAELISRIAVGHQVQAQERGIALSVQAAPNLPAVMIDPDRMAQVLGNLVANALRYTPAGGSIRLETAVVGQTLRFVVSDTGRGIDPADLPHIFQRFYRGEKARQQQEEESGLGLAIAKSLVHAHGGSITVNSSPGKGATFTISLPLNRLLA